jgi:hypothetical protein
MMTVEEGYMEKSSSEKRAGRRYDLHLPLRYRVSQQGSVVRYGTGMTNDLSAAGLCFRCRRPLPVGAHIELMIDWPAKHGNVQPITLQVTGFILRSIGGATAVRLASRRFRVETETHPMQASA